MLFRPLLNDWITKPHSSTWYLKKAQVFKVANRSVWILPTPTHLYLEAIVLHNIPICSSHRFNSQIIQHRHAERQWKSEGRYFWWMPLTYWWAQECRFIGRLFIFSVWYKHLAFGGAVLRSISIFKTIMKMNYFYTRRPKKGNKAKLWRNKLLYFKAGVK